MTLLQLVSFRLVGPGGSGDDWSKSPFSLDLLHTRAERLRLPVNVSFPPSRRPRVGGAHHLMERRSQLVHLSSGRGVTSHRFSQHPTLPSISSEPDGGQHEGENVKLKLFLFWLDDVISAAVMTLSSSTVIRGVYMGRNLRLQAFHMTSRCVVNVLYIEASALGHRGS